MGHLFQEFMVIIITFKTRESIDRIHNHFICFHHFDQPLFQDKGAGSL